MHKILIIALSLILLVMLIWLFTAGQIFVSSDNFIPANLYKRMGMNGGHAVRYDFSALQEKQQTEKQKAIVTRLGSGTFRFDDKVISLMDGMYSGEMGNKKVRVTLSNIFFSPADTEGKEPAIVVLSYEERGVRGTAYYIVMRLPDGSFSRGAFVGANEDIHSVSIKNGIISVKHHIGDDDPLQESTFAIARETKKDPITIEPVPATLVLNK